jgi:PAS domain S-box-containing protein
MFSNSSHRPGLRLTTSLPRTTSEISMLSADHEAETAIPFAATYEATQSTRGGARSVQQEIAGALRDNLGRGFLESEERFRQIVDALDDIVALADSSGSQIFYVNAAYDRIWGRPRESLYEHPRAFLEGVHPEDREWVRDAIFGDPGKEFDIEFRVVRPDDEERWVWSRGFPVRKADGAVYRIASITEDVTERKAIAASHDRLLRGFTHDLRNPLGAADGYLSLMELGVYGEMSAPQLEIVGRARRTIRTALSLASQLLDIERAKAGELIIARARVDLGAMARECLEDLRPAANAKRQSLTLTISDEDELVVESDHARVRQILANLLSNAVKYTEPDGRITVSARLVDGDAAPLHVSCVAVAVADNGPGIPPEKHRLLFREFTRLDPAVAEGSGIGLAISQHIARALGATITFASPPGVGSTFTLWLPREP